MKLSKLFSVKTFKSLCTPAQLYFGLSALSILAFGFCNEPNKKANIGAFRRTYSSDYGQSALKENVTLLHCTTEYPAPLDEINLKAINTLKNTFGLNVGCIDDIDQFKLENVGLNDGQNHPMDQKK